MNKQNSQNSQTKRIV